MNCENIDECEKHCKALDDWHVAGFGETLEKSWQCTKCSRTWREVYVFSCMIDNKTDQMI